jgi:hypothetical protein
MARGFLDLKMAVFTNDLLWNSAPVMIPISHFSQKKRKVGHPAVLHGPSAIRMILTSHLNKDRICPDEPCSPNREFHRQIADLWRVSLGLSVLVLDCGLSRRGFVVSCTNFMLNDSPDPVEPANGDTFFGCR